MRFEGLIFDMGDVFFDATPWRRWLTDRLQSLGVKITYDQLVEKWESLLVDVYCGRADYWKRFDELLASVGLDVKLARPLAADARDKGKEVQVDRKPFDGVGETLARLKAEGVKLAVLSDTESSGEEVRAGLRQLGLDQYFDAVITSRDIGYAKPAREAYQAAADALAVAADRCGFVGHDADELIGAEKAGLCAIAFNCDPALPADAYIQQFSDLGNLVLGNP